MDEITYTVLETVHTEKLTRNELQYVIEHKFEPTKHIEVVRVIALLFNANYIIQRSLPGFSISHSDKVYLSEDASKLFMNEKAKKEKQFEKDRLANDKLKVDLKNAKRISKTYWLTFGIAVAAFLISLVLLIIKLKGQ
jgi:hypothetical protein